MGTVRKLTTKTATWEVANTQKMDRECKAMAVRTEIEATTMRKLLLTRRIVSEVCCSAVDKGKQVLF